MYEDSNKIVNYTNKPYLFSSYHTRHIIDNQKFNLVPQLNSVQDLNSITSVHNSTILDEISTIENSKNILKSYYELTPDGMTHILDSHFTNNMVHSNDLQNTYLKYTQQNNITSSDNFLSHSTEITSLERDNSFSKFSRYVENNSKFNRGNYSFPNEYYFPIGLNNSTENEIHHLIGINNSLQNDNDNPIKINKYVTEDNIIPIGAFNSHVDHKNDIIGLHNLNEYRMNNPIRTNVFKTTNIRKIYDVTQTLNGQQHLIKNNL